MTARDPILQRMELDAELRAAKYPWHDLTRATWLPGALVDVLLPVHLGAGATEVNRLLGRRAYLETAR